MKDRSHSTASVAVVMAGSAIVLLAPFFAYAFYLRTRDNSASTLTQGFALGGVALTCGLVALLVACVMWSSRDGS